MYLQKIGYLSMDSEEYFSEAPITGRCVICGEVLYNNDGYIASDTDEMLCSYKCVVKFLNLKCDDDEQFEPCKCTYCGDELTDEYESVTVDGERFCGIVCAFIYSNIK